jgi:phosphatidylglycerol:prolipoprotein diacylglycerol transferase
MGAYLLFAGTERFLVEFLRAKDDRILAGFTVAQLASIVIALVGVIIMARLGKQDEVAIPANSILRGPKTT